MESTLRRIKRLLLRKGRKYPIKRKGKYGLNFKSARQRCFLFFDRGMTPAEAAEMAGVSPRTARRYKADWEKLPHRLLQLRY